MGDVVECHVGGETVLLHVDSRVEGEDASNREMWRARTYTTKEPDTLAWIDAFFREGDVIYDIGANIGQYSLYAAKRLHGNCTVLAFEPEALNYAKLNRNIVLNGLTGIIMPYCLAVTEKMALDAFYVQSFAPGAALHSWGRPVTQGERPFSPQNQQGMVGLSLDDLTGRFGLPFPNHIKIDVDGTEADIVRGAAGTLSDRRLKTALVEVYMFKNVADEIEEAFASRGFGLTNAEQVDHTPGTVRNLTFTRGVERRLEGRPQTLREGGLCERGVPDAPVRQ
jgi:FkbM family methyltransferase